MSSNVTQLAGNAQHLLDAWRRLSSQSKQSNYKKSRKIKGPESLRED
ncbi:MAG: hypothetical protein LAT63_00555 [Marinobacter sp.]|nr:hypothetical protein [Marinobacter sp.]